MSPSSRGPERLEGVTAIILAAGVGSRMQSQIPKVLHQLLGRPMAGWVVAAATEAFAAKPVVVISPATAGLADLLGGDVLVAEQSKPLGTADAVRCALAALPPSAKELLIACGDTPLITGALMREVVAARRETNVPIALAAFDADDPTGYGRVIESSDGTAECVIEERDASEEQRAIGTVNAGLYAVDRAWLAEGLDAITPSKASGELYLTDLIAAAHAAGTPAPIVYGPEIELEGVNDRHQFADVAAALRERINEGHLDRGVALIDPTTAWIDVQVKIAADAVIEPSVTLLGATSIGARTRIGSGSRIEATSIGEDCIIRSSAIESSSIASHVDVGPFAHIRPGCTIGSNCHVGNFAELKATSLATGAKVGHHSYLGDAEVGERANIGAGTITANYDGVKKVKTLIGADAFTGVGTLIVAPAGIGVGAKTGAGTVVLADIPDGCTAVGVPARIIGGA
jgi:bifunctional UDP-N-acetylglucosamine pyrophosphorylase/glucosamine-1-phosphate N-acetyltransferase